MSRHDPKTVTVVTEQEAEMEVLVELDAPPKPPLALRVGIVGHRPDRLKGTNLSLLGQSMKGILAAVQAGIAEFAQNEGASLYDLNQPPILRALSPLAEGSDRIFARQALDLGYELCCITPFRKTEYENDFAEGAALEQDSLAHFRELYEEAKTHFELLGDRLDLGGAYGDCGRVVLGQSDLLIVVWDGVHLNKPGGTEETLRDARRRGVPVVLVNPHSPRVWELLPGKEEATPKRLMEAVHSIVGLPVLPKTHELPHEKPRNAREDLLRFYAEERPKFSLAISWKAFRDVVADNRIPSVSTSVEPFEGSVLGEWPQEASIANQLRPFYAWTDKLAVLYADRYRSAFIFIYALAPLAVGLALVPILLDEHHKIFEYISTPMEIASILGLLFAVWRGRKLGWHERWIDYRLAAEMTRQLRLLALVAGERSFSQLPAHYAAYGHPTTTWMDWYLRALTRYIGLPKAALTKDYLTGSLDQLDSLLDSQLRFHQTSAARTRKMEHRLHVGVVASLSLTLVACCLHVARVPFSSVLTFFCAFLPAIGASLVGISNQAEFRRVSKRSSAMEATLDNLKSQSFRLRKRSDKLTARDYASGVRNLASDVAKVMVNDVLDWRVVFLDRPLEIEA